MNIIVVRVGTITHPMTQSIIRMFVDMGIRVSVVTTKNQADLIKLFDNKVQICEIPSDYTKHHHIIWKFFRLFRIRRDLWKKINELYSSESILWIGHNITIKHLGCKILKYRYILHLNELNENIVFWPRAPFFKMDTEKIGNSALAVVVPEYNRAHIVKAMWKLRELPFIMPNKPYLPFQAEKDMKVTRSPQAEKLIYDLKNKKIILYQGAISKERKIDIFIKAVEKMGTDYAFVVMSGDLKKIDFHIPDNCYLIDFIPAPYHLEVTSHAYIGILSYIPEKTSNHILNSIYCAPNKIFEYSMFSIPMISNDAPSLKMLFDKENCGICLESERIDQVIHSIHKIEENYTYYSLNALKFYHSVNNKKVVQDIIQKVNIKTGNSYA